jgi:uncharacterized membrane protein YkvA (DUF1232 family)
MEKWKARAQQLQRETYALYLAYQDPRTPWYARLLAAVVVAYAFSPIDLIPDPIPVLGYLDDLVLVPLGIALALKMIPDQVLIDARAQAAETIEGSKPVSRAVAAVIVAIWLVTAGVIVALMVRALWR